MSGILGRLGLVLKRPDFRKNTAALFADLEKNPREREEFIRNPAGKLASRVTGERLPEQRVSDANRVLFAMMANDEFRKWLDTYDASPKGQRVSDQQFARDFASAVLRFGDSDLLRALFKHASDGFGIPGMGGPSAQQLVTGPEKTFITSPATPSSSSAKVESSQNFNHSGFHFGDTRLVDPAVMRAVVEQLLTHARDLKARGVLADLNQVIR